ncbi:MAG: YibE/F family protein [Treponema sp.]|nr:YibE/F family protein [Treponema sp.]
MIRISIPYLITIAGSVLFLVIGHYIAITGMYEFQNNSSETARAKVESVQEIVQPDYDFLDDFDESELEAFYRVQGEKIIFNARITSGQRKGQVVTAEQGFSPLLRDYSKSVEKGDLVILFNNELGWYFAGYARLNQLIVLGVIFILCLLFFGGVKGFNTILSLGFTCASIFWVFIPSILSGKNIYLMSFLICAYTTSIVPLIVMGYNKKSLAAIIGCAGGIIIAGIITLIMDRALYLTGIVDEHSRYLVSLPGGLNLNLKAIIFAGIIIGAIGAIQDVSISLSSALWEIRENAKNIKFRELLKSGINIGRDIMGAMANTLILAYIGSSLTIVILLTVYSGSPLTLYNSEMFAAEILQALAGSLGILFAMPFTALFCAFLYLKENKNN